MARTDSDSQWISGVRIKDLVLGTGEEMRRGRYGIADVRMFLRKGDELVDMDTCGPETFIELGKRRKNLGKHKSIPGLRLGVEGMRENGMRMLIISPHLAFGAEGLAGRVPPNAVIHCLVELKKVCVVQDRPSPEPSAMLSCIGCH